MSLVIDLIDLVAKHKSGELRCPATALISQSLTLVLLNIMGSEETNFLYVHLEDISRAKGQLIQRNNPYKA